VTSSRKVGTKEHQANDIPSTVNDKYFIRDNKKKKKKIHHRAVRSDSAVTNDSNVDVEWTVVRGGRGKSLEMSRLSVASL